MQCHWHSVVPLYAAFHVKVLGEYPIAGLKERQFCICNGRNIERKHSINFASMLL